MYLDLYYTHLDCKSNVNIIFVSFQYKFNLAERQLQ